MVNKHEELKIKLAVLNEKIQGFEAWQKRQNGTLEQINKKLENIHHWIMALLGGLIIDLISRLI